MWFSSLAIFFLGSSICNIYYGVFVIPLNNPRWISLVTISDLQLQLEVHLVGWSLDDGVPDTATVPLP